MGTWVAYELLDAARAAELPHRLHALLSASSLCISHSNTRLQVVGHSVGTWVAYELLVAARAAGLPAPRAAFLSAMPAPDLPPAERPWRPQRSLSEADFKARRI